MKRVILYGFVFFASTLLAAQVKTPEVLIDFNPNDISEKTLSDTYQSQENFRAYNSTNKDSVDRLVRYRERTKVNNRPVMVDHYFLLYKDVLVQYRLLLLNSNDTTITATVKKDLNKGVFEGSTLVVDF
jgi:hypothetical protein